jgi:predicted ABC-type exoprotein transport system permease subunit
VTPVGQQWSAVSVDKNKYHLKEEVRNSNIRYDVETTYLLRKNTRSDYLICHREREKEREHRIHNIFTAVWNDNYSMKERGYIIYIL